MKCGEHAKTETLVVNDTNMLAACHFEENEMVHPFASLCHESNALNNKQTMAYVWWKDKERHCTNSSGNDQTSGARVIE